MGTHSTITFIARRDGKNIPLVTIYQQYDGYIDGVGHDLAQWLLNKKIINGIGSGQFTNEFANGAGCLAAQFIRDFKDDVGGLYIVKPSATYDYNYYVIVRDEFPPVWGADADDVMMIEVRCGNDEEPIFVGTPSELLNFEESDED